MIMPVPAPLHDSPEVLDEELQCLLISRLQFQKLVVTASAIRVGTPDQSSVRLLHILHGAGPGEIENFQAFRQMASRLLHVLTRIK